LAPRVAWKVPTDVLIVAGTLPDTVGVAGGGVTFLAGCRPSEVNWHVVPPADEDSDAGADALVPGSVAVVLLEPPPQAVRAPRNGRMNNATTGRLSTARW
jgi:hypothetical protein